jgi:cell wall-associated NlpC family hydrolase
VQTALAACGIEAPRDSDMQEAALGQKLQPGDIDELWRGDLLFWPGHVAIVRDGETVIHANAFHMAVEIESLRKACARIERLSGPIRTVRRLDER